MNDMYQLMLGMMAGGEQAASARSTLLRMVSEQEGMDPATRALLTRTLGPTEDETDAADAGGEYGGARVVRRRQLVSRLRSRFDAMQDELDELRERQDRLAAALGACAECWGEDLECEVCGGTGTPGAFVPDPRLYRAIVSPVCRAAGAGQRRLVRVIDPPPTPANGGAQ
jgi:hypothetical protein